MKPKVPILALAGILMLVAVMLGVPAAFAAGPGDIVINEIMQNPSAVGDSAGEWFEIHNVAGRDIDINGWTIKDDGTDSHVIDNGGELLIPAGGYLVLGNNTDSGSNGGISVDYGYGSNWFLSNSADEVILEDNSGVEIDRVEYDNGATFPDPNGASMALIDPALDNNVGANWCTSPAPWTGSAGDSGSPGAVNDCPSGAPAIVINEIIQNPSAVSDTDGEWFELYNAGSTEVDIDGWTIQDNDFDNHLIDNGGPLAIPAGGYLVLGRNADFNANGGVNVDYQYANFSLANGGDEVVLTDAGGGEVDRVEYDGGPNFPNPTGASMALIEPALDNNVGANWCTASTPYGDGDLGTPGAANDCPSPPPALGYCGDPAIFIHEVQGPGASSPLVGQVVIVEGVVVGDFEESNELSGFNLQEEDVDADSNPLTSEGVFVNNSGFGPGVLEGDVVRVQGIVQEFFGLTRLNSVSDMVVCVDPVDNTTTPGTVTLPVSSLDVWETVEGMEITIPQTLYASGNYSQGRYGEVDLSVGAPLDNPTNVVAPGAAANAMQELNNRSRIQLDDGSNAQNPLPLPPYIGAGVTLRTGDTIPSLTGALGFGFGVYEIHPTGNVAFSRDNVRQVTPDVGGSIHVAAYNVLNYFTTLDNGDPICGPLANQDCRGADNAFEFGRQKAKLVNAISQLDADIVGLMEIENYPGDVPIADLVDGINSVAGAGTYSYIATGAVGTDAIRVGILYKSASVTPVGDYAILDQSVDSRFNDEKNRPVLAQTFMENGTDDVVTVAVNHLKSKGSDCNDLGDPDAGDGQGNCNGTRTAAAAALADWLAGDPTGMGSGQYLITGDLNAYAMEDPVTTLEAAQYTNLIEAFIGSGWADSAYSYNFFSQSGYLDHGLASPALLPRVTGVSFWHVNSDEPSALNYNDYNQPALYFPHEFRSSDHDPVVVGICETTAPVVTAAASPDELWPPNHKYVDVTVDVDVDEDATITLLSVTSNEPDNGLGDGDTPNDIVIVDDFNFQLRAERSGKGNGRIYTITYEVTDDCGNSTIATAEVTVPKSKGKKK